MQKTQSPRPRIFTCRTCFCRGQWGDLWCAVMLTSCTTTCSHDRSLIHQSFCLCREVTELYISSRLVLSILNSHQFFSTTLWCTLDWTVVVWEETVEDVRWEKCQHPKNKCKGHSLVSRSKRGKLCSRCVGGSDKKMDTYRVGHVERMCDNLFAWLQLDVPVLLCVQRSKRVAQLFKSWVFNLALRSKVTIMGPVDCYMSTFWSTVSVFDVRSFNTSFLSSFHVSISWEIVWTLDCVGIVSLSHQTV